MELGKITEGISGQSAANIIYENDSFVLAKAEKANAVIAEKDMAVSLTNGGGYSKSSGALLTSEGAAPFRFAALQNVEAGASLIYTGAINGGSLAGVVFYNSLQGFIGFAADSSSNTTTRYVNKVIPIPSEAVYVGICGLIAEPLSVIQITPKGLEVKADHGYPTGVKPKTLKQVDDEIESIFSDSDGNLIYSSGVIVTDELYLNGGGSLVPTNGSYGVVLNVPVEEGQQYCVQGIGVPSGSGWVIRIAGRDEFGINLGLITPDNSGNTFDGWATVTIPAGVTYINFMFLLPEAARAFQVKKASAPSTVTDKKILPKYLPDSSTGGRLELFVDPVNGNDANNGLTEGQALATITKFREKALTSTDVRLTLLSGIYTEPLNLSGLKGRAAIEAKEGAEVIFTGGQAVTGWAAVAGYTGVYRALFSGTVPVHGSHNNNRGIVFEVGRPSLPILEDERHSAQKGLSHRLPFTGINQNLTATLADLSANGGWYVEGGYMYLKTSDGTSPTTNGFSYQFIARSTFTDSATLDYLYLKGVSFRLTTPVRFAASFVERYNCSILACTGDGFVNDTKNLRAFFDECAYCGNDGANGHFNAATDWQNLPLRNSGNIVEHYYGWYHDNFDDGLSYHEAGHTYILGGLFEYNGDGGVRPSNTCSAEIHNAYARRNGTNIASGGSVKGSGFDVVNAALAGDTRNGNNVILYNCVSENNVRGYATISGNSRITLVNCIAKDNTYADFNAETGTLIAKNCRVSNIDPSKIKVITGTGEIDIQSFEDLV